MNLITDRWIPARTIDGTLRHITPAEVGDPDLAGLALSRSDLNGAVTEFLIALLTTAATPADEDIWADWLDSPPSEDQLSTMLGLHAHAFEFETFMQTPLDCETQSIEDLLISSPGANTVVRNADFLDRAGSATALSPRAAIAAVIAAQMFAPQGGVGYFTSIRSGGPLSTLIVSGDTLWGRIWPNVETKEQLADRAVGTYSDSLEAIYPWLSPLPEGPISPDGANPLLVYWALPRRVQLITSPANGDVCSLTGEAPDELVRECRFTPGVKYNGWEHPFTPYWRRKDDEPWMATKGRSEPLGYRDWLGVVQSTSDERGKPARTISHALTQRWQIRDPRIVAYGYDTKSAQVLGWGEGEMPVVTGDRDLRVGIESTAKALVLASKAAVSALGKSIASAKCIGGVAIAGYWEATEPLFHASLAEAVRLFSTSEDDDPALSVRERWIVELRKAAYQAFDQACPLDVDHGGHLGRVVAARDRLASILRGYGPAGKSLFEDLGLTPPEPKKRIAA